MMTDTTAGSGTSVASIAGEVSTIDEAIMKFLPFIGIATGLIPGAQIATPFIPMISELLTVVDSAAKNVAAGNPGMAFQDVLGEIMNHLTPGQPNSPALAPEALPQASESSSGSG